MTNALIGPPDLRRNAEAQIAAAPRLPFAGANLTLVVLKRFCSGPVPSSEMSASLPRGHPRPPDCGLSATRTEQGRDGGRPTAVIPSRDLVRLYRAAGRPLTDAEGAGDHCEMMNRSLLNRCALDWLDAALGVA